LRKRVSAGDEPIRLVEFEEAVDLVGEEVDPPVGERVGEPRPLSVGWEHARGVVGSVDDDEARLRP
jgi:hypothetical protein